VIITVAVVKMLRKLCEFLTQKFLGRKKEQSRLANGNVVSRSVESGDFERTQNTTVSIILLNAPR
jgi:hypothetical protein